MLAGRGADGYVRIRTFGKFVEEPLSSTREEKRCALGGITRERIVLPSDFGGGRYIRVFQRSSEKIRQSVTDLIFVDLFTENRLVARDPAQEDVVVHLLEEENLLVPFLLDVQRFVFTIVDDGQ